MGNDDQPVDPVRQPDEDPRWRPTPTRIAVAAILCVCIVVPLLTSTFSRIEPRLFGFPFFYWYQFVWVFLAAGGCFLSYRLLRRESRAFDRQSTGSEQEGDA